VLREDSGKDLYGAEEWKVMKEQNDIAWVNFPCGNHSRNLHFDAYNRNFATLIKERLQSSRVKKYNHTKGRTWLEICLVLSSPAVFGGPDEAASTSKPPVFFTSDRVML
jgi:hypothetical protein